MSERESDQDQRSEDEEERPRREAAMTLAQALADADRLRVAAALIEGCSTVDELANRLGLRAPDISRQLNRLEAAGMLITGGDPRARRYQFDLDRLQALRRTALARPPSESAADELEPGWEQKVLRGYFDGERLKEIPAQLKRQRVVLAWLADRFDPATRYSERQVNEILRRHHPDAATLRRALVDNGFLDRDHGVYWRTVPANDEQPEGL